MKVDGKECKSYEEWLIIKSDHKGHTITLEWKT